MWVNLYWDLAAIKENKHLPQNLVFSGMPCKTREQAELNVLTDSPILKHIATVEVSEDITSLEGWN